MESRGVTVDRLRDRAFKCAETGQTVIYVARDGRLQGIIALSNTARKGVKTVLKRLRQLGVRHLSLISGDSEPVVRTISESLGFDHYEASMLPEEKALYIDRLRAEDRQVLMVGDGVNDALALSKAEVGVAMGAGGSEVAVETADIALAGDELEGLVILRLLSQQTLRVIEQNFWIANATNFAGILLGAGGWLPPVMAGVLHIGHTLGIMINSGHLMRWEPRDRSD
jgi:cation-transporting P-type ATPase C